MRAATIAVTPGANVTCTFTNVKPPTGQITIVKAAKPDDAQDFRFTPSVATIPSFLLDDDPSNNTLTNSKTFSNLSAGSSTSFTETQVPGWSLASIVCMPSPGTTINAGGSATVVMAPGGSRHEHVYQRQIDAGREIDATGKKQPRRGEEPSLPAAQLNWRPITTQNTHTFL